MIARILLLAAFVAVLANPSAADEESPPAGYSWQAFEDVGAKFLRPDGWYFKSEGEGSDRAYFITRERIEPGEFFSTGMSVNVVPRVGSRSGQSAVDYASAFIAACPGRGRLINSWTFEGGAFQGFGCQVVIQPKPEIVVRLHMVAIGNHNTDTAYIITFESPEAEWSEAWAIGKPMLDRMGLEDEY